MTLSASILQRAGFIQYRRGHVEITDRHGLESAACECYEVIRSALERVAVPQPL